MIANNNASNSLARLNRIKVVSRVARFVILGFLLFTGWMLVRTLVFTPMLQWFNGAVPSPWSAEPGRWTVCSKLLSFGFAIALCVWYWKLAQLFGFYERGLIFGGKTIRCIKMLGLVIAAGWLMETASQLSWLMETASHLLPHDQLLPGTPLPAGVSAVTHTFRMSFFSFDLGAGIDFGPPLAGLVIIVIAWIMDEGRKIQEEQELTV